MLTMIATSLKLQASSFKLQASSFKLQVRQTFSSPKAPRASRIPNKNIPQSRGEWQVCSAEGSRATRATLHGEVLAPPLKLQRHAVGSPLKGPAPQDPQAFFLN